MDEMNISLQQLLGKMEKELNEAKGSSTTARMRERVHAIKSLCELILDDSEKEKGSSVLTNFDSPPAAQLIQPATTQQPKRMQMDDQANGDSLFDF